MTAPKPGRRYTPEEYLAWERAAEYKHEYIEGYIVPMSGANREHSRINSNLAGSLGTQLLDGPCELFVSGMRVKVSKSGVYTYPDAVVVCGEGSYEDAAFDTLLDPTVIIRVLSSSTEAYDRGAKFGYYRELPSLQEYIVISQDKPLIEQYVRDEQRWLVTATSNPDAAVFLSSIGCELSLHEVYRRVSFPEPQPANSMGLFEAGQEDDNSVGGG